MNLNRFSFNFFILDKLLGLKAFITTLFSNSSILFEIIASQ